MKRVRLISLSLIIILTIILIFLLIGNPLFLKDILRAIRDTSLELTITGLLVVGLFWGGLEVNHRTKIPTGKISVQPVSLPGSGLMNAQKETQTPETSFWEGISTEMIGAVITTVLLGMLVLIFQQYQAIQNRKDELILQMGSPDNTTAIEAVRQLEAEDWLADGSLQGASLNSANLQGVSLSIANLQGAHLRSANLQGVLLVRANLQGASLNSANLQRAYLDDANLQEADLWHANLQEADLRYANLQGAYLRSANLQGADLWGANLQGAYLNDANLQGAILPDSSVWTSDTDMTLFTNPNRLNFWNPCVELTERVPWYCENQ